MGLPGIFSGWQSCSSVFVLVIPLTVTTSASHQKTLYIPLLFNENINVSITLLNLSQRLLLLRKLQSVDIIE